MPLFLQHRAALCKSLLDSRGRFLSSSETADGDEDWTCVFISFIYIYRGFCEGPFERRTNMETNVWLSLWTEMFSQLNILVSTHKKEKDKYKTEPCGLVGDSVCPLCLHLYMLPLGWLWQAQSKNTRRSTALVPRGSIVGVAVWVEVRSLSALALLLCPASCAQPSCT